MRRPEPNSSFELDVIRLPARVHWALTIFRTTTGLTAVSSVLVPHVRSGTLPALSPPVHPRCARRLRSVQAAPCRAQWLSHIRTSRRSPTSHSHTCPLGLRCSCVPLWYDGSLVGVVKLVAGPETSCRAFSASTDVLNLILSGICQDSLVTALSREVRALRQTVTRFREAHVRRLVPPASVPVSAGSTRRPEPMQGSLALVDSALSYLHREYHTPTVSLSAVAERLGCNPRYLTTRFSHVVGERMHHYLVRLRVVHACRLLMETTVPVKEAAYASGFRGSGDLARAFKRHVGVSPTEYRRIFAAP